MAAPHLYQVTQKKTTQEDRMIVVTINNLWLKCYLNICIILKSDLTNVQLVADKMRSTNTIAIALNGSYYFLEKNIKKIIHSFLATLITNSSSSAKIVQQILSFSDNFNAFTTSVGMVVLKDLECDACKLAVDSTSNNFIPPFMFFFINIFVNILYICYPHNPNK